MKKSLKNKLIQYFSGLFLILFLTTCNRASKDFVNPSTIKIYINDLEESSILPLDMWATSDNGFLIFGICGSSVTTKFDGDGSIYLLKIDANGNTEWSDCFSIFEGGFPTNVIRIDESHYTFLWNDIGIDESTHKVAITVGSDAASTVISTSPVINFNFECTFDCHYITSIVQNKNTNGFTVLGIGDEAVNDTLSINRTFILQTDSDFKNPITISEKEFSSEDITGTALDNLSVVKVIEHHNQLIADQNSYIFTAPIAKQMSLAHVGELDAIYRDNTFWVGAVNYLGESEISMVVNNPQIFGSPTYFIPSFRINSTNKFDFSSLPNKQEIFGLDTQDPIFIKTIGESQAKQILVGTTTEGQVNIHVYDLLTGQNEKILYLGQGTRYQAAAIAVSFDNKSLGIIGITTVSHQVQRPFLIRVDKSELFN